MTAYDSIFFTFDIYFFIYEIHYFRFYHSFSLIFETHTDFFPVMSYMPQVIFRIRFDINREKKT